MNITPWPRLDSMAISSLCKKRLDLDVEHLGKYISLEHEILLQHVLIDVLFERISGDQTTFLNC